jgi:hypothetical protein
MLSLQPLTLTVLTVSSVKIVLPKIEARASIFLQFVVIC